MFTVPLEKMSRAEKLRAMEALWQDLSRNEAGFKSPDWHQAILRERVRLVKAGKAKFSPWAEAKERIRREARAR